MDVSSKYILMNIGQGQRNHKDITPLHYLLKDLLIENIETTYTKKEKEFKL
jgi:hypothetical protein